MDKCESRQGGSYRFAQYRGTLTSAREIAAVLPANWRCSVSDQDTEQTWSGKPLTIGLGGGHSEVPNGYYIVANDSTVEVLDDASFHWLYRATIEDEVTPVIQMDMSGYDDIFDFFPC